MRIAICDDEINIGLYTKEIVEQSYKSIDLVVDIFSEAKKLLNKINKISYDLFIIDIEMPGIDGIETAKKIRNIYEKTPIVFLTSHVEYAIKGYEVNALRYLTKPATVEQLTEVISYLIEQKKRKKKLLLKNGEDIELVSLNEILYMEAQNQDIRIVTKEREYIRRYNLRDYEEELKNYYFIRCHRSYLINLAKVSRIVKKEIIMANEDRIPLSRTREKNVKEALLSFIHEEAF